MSLLDMDAILAQTTKAVEQMNQPAAPGEATREFYREQGRKQEQERIIKLLESDPEELIDAGGGLRAGYETAITLIKEENQ